MKKMTLAVLITMIACGRDASNDESELFVGPIAVASAVYGIYSAYQESQDRQAMLNDLSGIRQDIEAARVQILHAINQEQISEANGFISTFLQRLHNPDLLASGDIDDSGNKAVEKMMDVMKSSDLMDAVRAAKVLNIVAPMLAIILKLRGTSKAIINSTVFDPVYGANDNYLKVTMTTFTKKYHTHLVRIPGMPNFIISAKIAGFFRKPVGHDDLTGTYMAMSATLPEYQGIEVSQQDVAKILSRAMTKRVFLSGRFTSPGRGVLKLSDNGTYCGYISEMHLNLTGGSISNAVKNGDVPATYLDTLSPKPACYTVIKEGFFRSASDAVLYYSDGVNGYCKVARPAHVAANNIVQYDFNVLKTSLLPDQGICSDW